MGKWNYRVIDHGNHKALHEVYYDDDGNPTGWTESPATFVCDPDEDAIEIAKALSMALINALTKPVLTEEQKKVDTAEQT